MSWSKGIGDIRDVTARVIGVGVPVKLAAARFRHETSTARTIAGKCIGRFLGHSDLLKG